VCAFKDLDEHFQRRVEMSEISVCCKLPVAIKDKEVHVCDILRRRLAASQRERHIIDLFSGRLVFKFPPRAEFSTLGEYITSIESRSLDSTVRHNFPRRPIPTILPATTGMLLCIKYVICYNSILWLSYNLIM
jgi:hypothetical protein